MDTVDKIKYIVENTDLFIQVSGTNPNVVSDFGRAKFIDLDKQTVRFSRREVTARRIGDEMAWGQDHFLRTEIHLSNSSFDINKTYCKNDGSWQKWNMDGLKVNDWHDLYAHIKWVELDRKINKNWITKLYYRIVTPKRNK